MKKYKDKQWIFDMYYNQEYSTVDIARACGCNRGTITRWMDKFGFERRTPKKGGILKSKIYDYNINYFDNINTELKAYILGFILTDGCIVDNKSRKRLVIGIHPQDKQVLELISKELESNVPIAIREQKDKRYPNRKFKKAILCINSTDLCNKLIKLGVNPNKSGEELFPKVEDGLQKHFIRGVFDGDGHFCYGYRKSDNRIWANWGITSGKPLLEGVSQVLEQKLGVNPSVSISKHYGTYRKQYSNIAEICRIISYIYSNATFYLSRKYNTVQNFLDEDIVRALGKS